jgi:hypothetical protein
LVESCVGVNALVHTSACESGDQSITSADVSFDLRPIKPRLPTNDLSDGCNNDVHKFDWFISQSVNTERNVCVCVSVHKSAI